MEDGYRQEVERMNKLFEGIYEITVDKMAELFEDEPDRQKAGFQMGLEAALNLVLNTSYLERTGYGRVVKN